MTDLGSLKRRIRRLSDAQNALQDEALAERFAWLNAWQTQHPDEAAELAGAARAFVMDVSGGQTIEEMLQASEAQTFTTRLSNIWRKLVSEDHGCREEHAHDYT